MKFYIGIDVGGTKIAYGLFDEARKLLVRKQTASDDQKEGQEFFEPVLEIIREFMEEAGNRGGTVEGIGIGITGFVDFEKGALTKTASLPKLNNFAVVDYLKSGELPLRCTHNDTKLNNVMLDDVTGEGICVIDLDTTMPGSAIYDFGDMIRTATSPAAEDEKDVSKVTMRMFMFEALVQGYLSSAKSFLTPLEKSLLPFSGKLLTMECGIRFLTDYLSGDVYFKIHRPEHNLDRCRTQMALVESIEAQMDEMKAIVDRY